MFCSRCGIELGSNAAFCSSCGAPNSLGVKTLERLQRPGIVTLLAVLQFIAGGVWLLVGLASIAAVATGSEPAPFAAVVGVVVAGIAALQIGCGVGLWKLRPYGRTIQLVFAWIGLIGIPIGTIISICILIYLRKPGIKALFSGKRIEQLTAVELAQVAEATTGSAAATVLAVVAVVVGGVFLVGIVAAIAVPGLLRARMAANEAAAIGSLRAINSAQASYSSAAGAGGYARTLRTLAAACPGSSVGFISPDLGNDPSLQSGYRVALTSAGAPPGPRDCNRMPTELDYYATSVPVTAETTGNRAFATSAAGTIFFTTTGRAPSVAETLGATARPVQ